MKTHDPRPTPGGKHFKRRWWLFALSGLLFATPRAVIAYGPIEELIGSVDQRFEAGAIADADVRSDLVAHLQMISTLFDGGDHNTATSQLMAWKEALANERGGTLAPEVVTQLTDAAEAILAALEAEKQHAESSREEDAPEARDRGAMEENDGK